jgi:hypothetical protein
MLYTTCCSAHVHGACRQVGCQQGDLVRRDQRQQRCVLRRSVRLVTPSLLSAPYHPARRRTHTHPLSLCHNALSAPTHHFLWPSYPALSFKGLSHTVTTRPARLRITLHFAVTIAALAVKRLARLCMHTAAGHMRALVCSPCLPLLTSPWTLL